MVDRLTTEERSRLMSAVRGRDTSPELAVRRLATSFGFRYRLHSKKLPGRPDLVFPGLRKAVFVHGCFWHRHRCRRGRSMPATRIPFWTEKFTRNVERDAAVRKQLRRAGWQVLIVWECKLTPKNIAQTAERLKAFLTAK
ncbi:MAG: very short patch repair endonuclease [Planctomycetia bacterium]|nr:very short patch repair endonuclease [Planctomycetia bacterium]